MSEVKKCRKIQKEVMAVQITGELLEQGIPIEFPGYVVINHATKTVQVMADRGREIPTGGISDWLVQDSEGNTSIISPADFAREYEEVKEKSTWDASEPDPIIGGQTPTESTDNAPDMPSTPPGEDINLDNLENDSGGNTVAE